MVFEDLRVFDLIDTTDNGTWNQVVIKTIIQLSKDANYLSIPLHQLQPTCGGKCMDNIVVKKN